MQITAGSVGDAPSFDDVPPQADDRQTWAELWRLGAAVVAVLGFTASVAALILACL